jgi:hypothetical protein
VINLKKEDLDNTRKTSINTRNVRKNKHVIKDRVDKYPLISYIYSMKEKTLTIT